MQWKSTSRSADDRGERGAGALGHRRHVREEVQRRADEAVGPVVPPELLIVQTVQIHFHGAESAWSPVSVTLSLAGLAQVDDGADPFRAELLPPPRSDRVDVLGPVEDSSRCGGAVAAPEPSKVASVDQSVDHDRPTLRAKVRNHRRMLPPADR